MSDWNSNPEPNPVPPPLGTAGGGATRVCVECGKLFAADEMIKHGDSYVCAGCKPIFMQKLAEGARIDPLAFRYAGFWIRILAWFLDAIVMNIFSILFRLALGLSAIQTQESMASESAGQKITAGVLGLVIGIAYEVFFIGKYGATLGKMACRIKVVTADGGPVSYLRALGRWASKIVSAMILCIGYIMVGFDAEKRGLHDRMCDTRVIYK